MPTPKEFFNSEVTGGVYNVKGAEIHNPSPIHEKIPVAHQEEITRKIWGSSTVRRDTLIKSLQNITDSGIVVFQILPMDTMAQIIYYEEEGKNASDN
jgi:hypothetical protein